MKNISNQFFERTSQEYGGYREGLPFGDSHLPHRLLETINLLL